jgi:hypothetical protein
MPALVSDLSKRWPGKIPYRVGLDNIGGVGRTWLLARLQEFNTACGVEVFKPRNEEADYVEFEAGSDSPIGKQTGRQICRISRANVYHEIGHAIGLGHTYFHTACRITSLFAGMDRIAYDQHRNKYAPFGNALEANSPSMMAYSPGSFPGSPRIQRVVDLAHNARGALFQVRAAAVARQQTLQAPAQPLPQLPHLPHLPQAHLPLQRRGSDAGPHAHQPLNLQPHHPNGVGQMDLAQVTEFIHDIDIVAEYWAFDPGFMLRVFPIDKRAVREALGLSPGA